MILLYRIFWENKAFWGNVYNIHPNIDSSFSQFVLTNKNVHRSTKSEWLGLKFFRSPGFPMAMAPSSKTLYLGP